MESERVLRAAPLLEGEFRERRKEIRINLLRLTLGEFEKEEVVSTTEVTRKCAALHNVEFNQYNVGDLLNEVDDSEIEAIDKDTFRINDPPKFEGLEEKIGRLWDGFSEVLSKYRKEDIDPYYASQVRPGFISFFERFIKDIADSVSEIQEQQRDTIHTHDGRTERIIEEIAESNNITDKTIFKGAIQEYLSDPDEDLLHFINSCYSTAVNVELLSREEEVVELSDIPARNRVLLLDTNIIVALLADSDKQHHLAHQVCKRSRSDDLDFSLYYTEKTRDELNGLIDSSENEMDGVFEGDYEIDTVNNQFVKDFSNKPEQSWESYLSEIRDWESIIAEEYNIELFDKQKSPNEVVENTAREMFLEHYSFDVDRHRLSRIEHDSNILGLAAVERKFSSWDFGPFVLSFHNVLTQIGRGMTEYESTESIVGGKPLALQPRSWINYILAFSSANLESDDKLDIANSVIQIASDFERQITMDEFVHVLAPKVDLGLEDEDSLKRFLVNHPTLSDDIEEAVREDRGHEAEQLARNIVTDTEYIETIQEERQFQDRIQNARKRIEELEDEIEELEKQTEEGSDEFTSNYVELRRQFLDLPKEIIIDYGFSIPPEDGRSVEEIKEWLEDAIVVIRTSSDTPEELLEIKDKIALLLSEAILLENSDD